MTEAKMRTFVLPQKVSLKGSFGFTLYLILMLAGLFLRNALSVNLPPILFLALTVLPLLWGDQSQIIATAVCCIPFSTGFQFKYALLLCIVMLVIKNRKHFKWSAALTLVLIMAAWELLHGIGAEFSLAEYPRSMAELLLLGVVFSLWDKESLNYRLILRGYAVAMVGVCFIMLYLQLAKNGFNLGALLSQNVHFRFGEGNTDFAQYALNFNPNGLGFDCCLAAACCLFFLRKREFRVKDGILLFFSVGFCILTLSRTAFVCLAALALGYLLLLPMPGLKRLLYLLLTAGLLTVVVVILYQIMPGVFENLFFRFGEEDVTNGRDELFMFYNQHIFSAPQYFLFGIGLQSISEKITAIHGVDINVPHNGYQEAIVVWGLLGVLLLLLLFWSTVRETRGENRRHLVAFVPLGVLLLYGLVGQIVTSGTFLISILLASVIMAAEGQGGALGESRSKKGEGQA